MTDSPIFWVADALTSLLSGGDSSGIGGTKFDMSYVSGHPNFHSPDTAGRLIIGRERLHYTTTDSQQVFAIPIDLVNEAKPLGSDRLLIRLVGGDSESLDVHFRASNSRDLGRFLEALKKRRNALL